MTAPLVLVTPTSGRPEAFNLLRRWVREQDYDGPMEWRISTGCGASDDYVREADPLDLPSRHSNVVRVIRSGAGDGGGTLCGNLMAALRDVPADAKVVLLEDDDVYRPGYLSHYAELLDGKKLAGQGAARYYNVSTRRYRQIGNGGHASLAQTAFRGELAPLVRKLCVALSQHPKPFIDIHLWRVVPSGDKVLEPGSTHHLSIKGMPGKRGYGIGHAGDFGEPDEFGAKFAEWDVPSIYWRYFREPLRFRKEPGETLREAPAFSVAMVMRNGLEMTKRAVGSLMESTPSHLNWEFLLWDNDSTEPGVDAFLDERERDGYCRVYRSVRGEGWIRPINLMARESKGEFFVGANNDVVVHPGWWEAMVDPLLGGRGVAQTGPVPGCGFLDENFRGRPGRGQPEYIEGYWFMVPRWVVDRYGPYDEYNLEGGFGDDSDLSLRLRRDGYRIADCPGARIDHVRSPTWHCDAEMRRQAADFERKNLEFLRGRWADYLKDRTFPATG